MNQNLIDDESFEDDNESLFKVPFSFFCVLPFIYGLILIILEFQ